MRLPIVAARVSLVEIPDAVLAVHRAGGARSVRAATDVDGSGSPRDVEYPSDFGGDAASLFPSMLERRLAGRPATSVLGAIVDRELATAVGNMGTHAPPLHGRVEIGYTIAPAFASRNYATEMLRCFVEALFARAGIDEIVAETLHDNVASQRVLEKCGFVRSGERNGGDGSFVGWSLVPGSAGAR